MDVVVGAVEDAEVELKLEDVLELLDMDKYEVQNLDAESV